MESSSEKIKKTVKKIIPLLEYAEENYWLEYFNFIITELEKNNFQCRDIKNLSLIFKGGTGSFSDLVLHKNGFPLIAENNQLEKLKNELYEACEEKIRN